ncbi:MAG: hypothetical protein RB296_00035 [Acidobacteriota bacterium]|nr:hypothetical protein [Acidobacteriota bacterium]
MLNTFRAVGFHSRSRGSIVYRDILNAATDAYVRSHGYAVLGDPETPAFMRRLCGVAVRWPQAPRLVPETPGPVTRLLETLFCCVLGDDFALEDNPGILASH